MQAEAQPDPAREGSAADERIAVMDAALADQIAAGEVVERPASVVKELVENSVDAGATRIDVHLEDGGKKLIRVLDDGRGILPGQLGLALTRHATSKIRRADELVELSTLGFRGEALASIAAVARIRIRSRRPEADKGWELEVEPGAQGEERPAGMPVGTELSIAHLFANVPARRKFLRSEATEVGHCVERVLETALVNPGVRFALTHGGRKLLTFPAGDAAQRVAQVLGRRAPGPYLEVDEELEGVRVRGWFAPPAQASRQRGGAFVIVRRRVVKERALSNIVKQAYAGTVGEGQHVVFALFVDPAHGSVDVNVHPQKSEVRFSEPQRVYSALRRVLTQAFETAPWSEELERAQARAPAPESGGGAASALEAWSRSPAPESAGGAWARPYVGGGGGGGGGSSSSRYRLGTRAGTGDYARAKDELRSDAMALRTRLEAERQAPRRDESDDAAIVLESSRAAEPALLGTLPGPIAIFALDEELWAVDLRQLRAFLLLDRMRRELGGSGVVGQGLLPPITVARTREEVALVERRGDELERLGMVVERFGEDALIVRTVPAAMEHCRDETGVRELLDRVLPWLRLRDQEARDSRDASAGLMALASAGGRDPTPRYARRWLSEALALASVEALPGVERWTASELMRR